MQTKRVSLGQQTSVAKMAELYKNQTGGYGMGEKYKEEPQVPSETCPAFET